MPVAPEQGPDPRLRDGLADPDLRLIETLLWDGAAFPRLALHEARLTRSAAALGWARPFGFRAALDGMGDQPQRVRVTLDAAGRFCVQPAALPAGKTLWQVGLAKVPVFSADPWLHVKSTRRAVYDAARAALPSGLDEVLFLNERGEVCEGTITSVFFDRGQGLRTPPLTCGLLPGVLRAEMAVPEEVLLAEDLPDVQLWLGNALRGLMAAQLASADSAPFSIRSR